MDPIFVLILTLAFAGFLTVIIMLSKTQQTVIDPALVDDISGTGDPQEQNLDFKGHINAGNKAFSQYNYQDALYHFQAAANLNPNDPTVHFKVGRLFIRQEAYNKAIDAFNQVIRLNPQKVDAYYE
jgi:Flp pilus assembly protein TadD, contains TPR repeats